MKIHRLHLPTYDNAGAFLGEAHRDVRTALLEAFGGYTNWPAMGAWLSDDGKVFDEPVTVYEIAAGSNEDAVRHSAGTLHEIARTFGEAARQEAVFLIIDGSAEIVAIK